MRLDKYLKVTRLIKRRTIANEACDAGKVLVNDKIARASYDVKVGDIITINMGQKPVKVEVLNVTEYVKKEEAAENYRVIGTGGDKVVVDYNNNTVTVNGKVISNDNIREAMYNTNLFDEKYEVEENVFEYDVPEGKLFVMGDNRNNSTDSRRIGFIDPSDVLGKAVLRLYPFDSFGKVS